jgi:hypothetical protein
MYIIYPKILSILEILYAMLVEKELIKRALVKIAVVTLIEIMVTRANVIHRL